MLRQINIGYRKLFMIGLGSEANYNILQRNLDKFKNERTFWLYDRNKLDIAYFLANSKQKYEKFTYITRSSFETIQIKEKPLNQQVNKNDNILNIMENYTFRKVSDFYESHPYDEYIKICQFMNVPPEQDIKELFRLKFSSHPLDIKGAFYTKRNAIRQNYLKVEGLKLRKFDRKSQATAEEYLQNLCLWKQHYQIDQIVRGIIHESSAKQTDEKIKWIEQNNFGYEVESKYVFEGFGKKFSSFSY